MLYVDYHTYLGLLSPSNTAPYRARLIVRDKIQPKIAQTWVHSNLPTRH